VNVVLALVFAPLALLGDGGSLLGLVGARGLAINLFLAAVNLVPYGPLDGRTVLSWSAVVWAVSFVPVALVAFVVVFVLGVGF
jgi:Zn-dependent protease